MKFSRHFKKKIDGLVLQVYHGDTGKKFSINELMRSHMHLTILNSYSLMLSILLAQTKYVALLKPPLILTYRSVRV